MNWRFDLASEIGGRPEQQDRVTVHSAPDRSDHLLVLADGMGGRTDGAAAAQTVVDISGRLYAKGPPANPAAFLEDLCAHAHEVISALGRRRHSTPGSTCVLLYLRGAEAYWIHVGDSRLYRFRRNALLSSTMDHTLGELRKDRDQADEADPQSAVDDGKLYMSLGGRNALEPESGATAVEEGDWFLLCSDGFWSQVQAGEAADSLSEKLPEPGRAAELAAMAADRGGSGGDNVSVVLAVSERRSAKRFWRRLFDRG